ncbi:MAG: DMT family transporter [Spirochaetia bacterium]|nr:DMT family transporter [Spirochaetia bacterium]
MNNKTKGILCVLISSFSFCTMNVFIRFSGDLPTTEKVFFRNIIAAIVAAIILYKSKQKFTIQKRSIPSLIARCVFGMIAMLCNFYAVDHLLLSDVTIIAKLGPFFTIIFCYLFLKEIPRTYQIIGILIAFVGVYFIANPAFNNGSLINYIIAMTGAVTMGLAYTFLRSCLNKGENKSIIVFVFSLFSSLACIPLLFFSFVPMTTFQLIMLLGAGLSATAGQFGLTYAYYFASAKDVSIYDYFQLIWAAIYAYFLFNEPFILSSVIGYIIITSAAIFIFIKEQKTREIKRV